MDTLPFLSFRVALVVKVLIVLNSAWNLLNFRSGLIKALIEKGHEVVLAAPQDEHVPALQSLGASFVNLPMRAHGINPFSDLKLLWHMVCLLKTIKPAVLLAYTAKPNIYGGLAGRIVSIPVINNIAGLGSVFIKGGWVASVLTKLYRLALARSYCVFFQNPDDRLQFIERGLVKAEKTKLVPGSGINLNQFQVAPLPCLRESQLPLEKRRFVFLLVARLLRDKGVVEYVEAARQLKPLYPRVEFALLGSRDLENPNAVSDKLFNSWLSDGIVNYWGASSDVRIELALADCVVLPSYREGTPRSLLEAAAMGRPLIATDVPGCREVVHSGLNGLLCESGDSKSLANRMESLLNMTPEKLHKFAQASRALVQEQFDENLVIEAYLRVLEKITLKSKKVADLD
jgi:glycosyltransferase involved in cell wall biosynthesis